MSENKELNPIEKVREIPKKTECVNSLMGEVKTLKSKMHGTLSKLDDRKKLIRERETESEAIAKEESAEQNVETASVSEKKQETVSVPVEIEIKEEIKEVKITENSELKEENKEAVTEAKPVEEIEKPIVKEPIKTYIPEGSRNDYPNKYNKDKKPYGNNDYNKNSNYANNKNNGFNNNGNGNYNNNANGNYNNNNRSGNYNNNTAGNRNTGYGNNNRPSGFNNNANSRPGGIGNNSNNRNFNNSGTGNNYNRTNNFNNRNSVPRLPKADMPAPLPTKDITQKKKKPFERDDNKKQMNKKTLTRKGYVGANSFDDDTVRHIKQRKLRKQNDFTPNTINIQNAVIETKIVPIKVLAEKIGKAGVEIVKKLFSLGQMHTVNDTIDFDTAELIAMEFGITLEYAPTETAEDKLQAIMLDREVEGEMVKRPPVVTIMGHVDHGKTSLLDYIRKSKVAGGEAGGITQHIGAYTIELNGEPITFLDTPGHEAFTSMRKRGAKVTDIAVIVVAGDDGIMPQTVEAIAHAKEAGVSVMVAVNKMDKPTADVEKIKQQLTLHDIIPEEWGGDVIVCPVSAKTGMGVDELLENILLLAEVKELKAVKDCRASGSIIEARLDKGVGPVATVLVQNGTLKVADYVVAGTCVGKVRAMLDDNGKQIKEAGPSIAVAVQGFSEVPNAGDQMIVVKDEKLAKQVAQERANKDREDMQRKSNSKSLEDMFKNFGDNERKSLGIIIKGDVQGSVEAVKQALIKLSDEMADSGVVITIMHAGVGAINESDIMLADTGNAIVIGFNVRPEPKARALADKTKVDIRLYRIIYDAIEDVTKAMKGMLEPVFREEQLGHAEVRETFRITGVGTIAGCYVTDGKVARNAKFRLIRDNIIVFEGSISSMKRNKDEAKEVASGYECGIGLENYNDIKIGDIIEAFILKEEQV